MRALWQDNDRAELQRRISQSASRRSGIVSTQSSRPASCQLQRFVTSPPCDGGADSSGSTFRSIIADFAPAGPCRSSQIGEPMPGFSQMAASFAFANAQPDSAIWPRHHVEHFIAPQKIAQRQDRSPIRRGSHRMTSRSESAQHPYLWIVPRWSACLPLRIGPPLAELQCHRDKEVPAPK